MGDNPNSEGRDPIPFAAAIPTEKKPVEKNNVIPVAIAAFIGALAGAVLGSQLV
ncbi:MAG: hypothetical protein AB8G18_08440 [Gammaproteobacteria bacterium]